jgi:septal ring factor EnvC (AmiA/AmiB activator)
MRLFVATLLLTAAASSLAQAPVEDTRLRADAILQGQQKAGAAFRELQQSEYAVKQAEQEYLQADADYKAAQKRADDLKRPADAARKNLDAAKAKEAAARKSYEAAVNAVDQISQKPARK